MEIKLLNRSVYSLPSKQRVGALVFDGAADMQLWPGPGPEADLRERFGDGLQRALDAELKQTDSRLLEIPSVIRVHAGRLHCDFLLWAATREPEPGADRSAAPSLKTITKVVHLALEFASKRSVEKIAFPALGAGPGEAPREDRLVAIVEAAQAYYEECYAAGRSPGIEEVYVCDASGPAFRKAKNRTSRIASVLHAPAVQRTVSRPSRGRSRGPVNAIVGPSSGRSLAAKKARKKLAASESARTLSVSPNLSAEELEQGRGAAGYNMRNTYAPGDLFLHSRFGVGKVIDLPAAGHILCVFEDRSRKKLVHAR